jgi:hypothetical protein
VKSEGFLSFIWGIHGLGIPEAIFLLVAAVPQDVLGFVFDDVRDKGFIRPPLVVVSGQTLKDINHHFRFDILQIVEGHSAFTNEFPGFEFDGGLGIRNESTAAVHG